jgi:hypothetical protein
VGSSSDGVRPFVAKVLIKAARYLLTRRLSSRETELACTQGVPVADGRMLGMRPNKESAE